jgi:hypothetical protein
MIPGVIDTEMSNFTKTEDGPAVAMGMQSLKRIGTPADVASVIAFMGLGRGAPDHRRHRRRRQRLQALNRRQIPFALRWSTR